MEAEKAHFEVRSMCRLFGVAPSAYYAWEGEQESERARRDGELLAAIRRMLSDNCISPAATITSPHRDGRA